MPEERLDYSHERLRHERFVGRAALLTRLDRLLVADGADRWVVVTGGPGMGKSALLAAWLLRREAAGAAVPHHFIRRGEYDWDDPAKLVGSLVAQLEERYPEAREADADARRHPAARLAGALRRVSERALAPRGERLVVLIDGLDEYDPPAGAVAGDPLAAFLPHALPAGVRLVCASRPRHPYVSSLEARDGELVQIDLDDPGSAADNDATVRALWERAAPPLGLEPRFVDEAVARAGGNAQHAVTLQRHLKSLDSARRRVADIPRGLTALLEKAWERIATDPVVVHGLGILCAAREALALDELGAAAGWTADAERRAFLRGARELLVETQRPDGQAAYRLHHDSIRAHIAGRIGGAALRGHHAALAQRLATWPPVLVTARRYALRHALIHCTEAAEWAAAWRLAADLRFLEAKYRELGADATEGDVARVAQRGRVSGDAAIRRGFGDLSRALVRESHWLRAAPQAIAAIVWNRLRLLGWSAADIDAQLRVPAEAAFLRVRHGSTRENPALVRDLVGHADGVLACAVTADGRRVISAADDRTLKVWDPENGRVLATLEGHAHTVGACAVTADGHRVVSGAMDGTLKVWDLDEGHVLATLEGHTDLVFACAVTPEGRRVVSASADRTLKVWDLETGQLLATLEGHSDWVRACAVTADGRHVVSGSYDGTLKVWELERRRVLVTLEGHTDWVRACAVTPDGRRVVSGSTDGTLRVWELESGRSLAVLEGHACWVIACAVMPDGRRVVSGAADGTLKVWDLESGSLLTTLEGHADWVNACAVTGDGRHVISASADRTLKVWNLEHALGAVAGHAGWVSACAVTADGRRAVSASGDRTLTVWDLEGGRARALEGQPAWVRACAVTPDGRRMVSASEDRTLKVWDLERERVLATLEGHAGAVLACAITADGRCAVSASEDRTLKVWDLEDGRALTTLEGHAGRVRACAITPEGTRVISASADQTLKVWDLASGRALATLEGHLDTVRACAVTPDGRRVISASADRTLKVWDLASGRTLATLEGHAGWVNACAVTEDGRYAISASEDGTLMVWSLDTHACLLTHRGDAAYTAVAATAAVIVAGDATGGVWTLDWPTDHRGARPPGGGDRQEGQRAFPAARELVPPRRLMKKHTILFLAANPSGTDRLALDQEARAIEVELERAGYRDCFELVTRWAAEPLDLLRELRRLKPTVVHFSGHGGPDRTGEHRPRPASHRGAAGEHGSGGGEHRTKPGLRRDVDGALGSSGGSAPHGLFFQGHDGRPQVVSTAALEAAFGAAGASVRLVVLSACYSEVHAEALLAHVDCVVGMSGSILDDAARSFAIGFYGGLGEGESVADAFRQGCAAIHLEGLPDADHPRLRVRAGVDVG